MTQKRRGGTRHQEIGLRSAGRSNSKRCGKRQLRGTPVPELWVCANQTIQNSAGILHSGDTIRRSRGASQEANSPGAPRAPRASPLGLPDVPSASFALRRLNTVRLVERAGWSAGQSLHRGGAPQSSQRRFPHMHSNMWMMRPLRESTTVRTSFILLPQMPQILVELSSMTQIISARNISMKPALIQGD